MDKDEIDKIPENCWALVDALQSVIPLTQQYCTPGHRGGKAFAMFIKVLSDRIDVQIAPDSEVKNGD